MFGGMCDGLHDDPTFCSLDHMRRHISTDTDLFNYILDCEDEIDEEDFVSDEKLYDIRFENWNSRMQEEKDGGYGLDTSVDLFRHT